ncbi:MAG: oxidoreductase [Parasphingorhabdus sp.]
MVEKILIVGGTGLIGNLLIKELVKRAGGKGLHLLFRRPYREDVGAGKVHVQLQENWPATIKKLKPKTVISCLGTTIKKAGSQEAFAAVDRDLVASVAKAAKKAGARHFLSVSSTMADSSASSFYLKTKGEAEDALQEQNFDRLDIIRPGLLRGDRTNDFRVGERLAIAASPVMDILLHGKFRRYRSIHAENVATAIANLIGADPNGAHIHENDQIMDLV